MCVDDENKDKCTSDRYLIAVVIITRYLPLAMIPFISYLSIACIYPVIYFHLKRNLRKPDNSFYTKQDITLDSDYNELNVKPVARKWKALHLQGLLATNCYIFCVLWLCTLPADMIHCNDKDKGFLANTDHYISYIHKALSVIFLIIMIGGVFLRWRKLSFVSSVSISITVNIIYMVCYYVPKMLVEFTYDPSEATYNFCMTIVVILSAYPLTWYCLALFIFSKLALKQAYLSLCSWKSLFHFLTFAIMISFYCICFIIFGAIIEILRSDINYQYLRILCFLINSLVVCLFKPVHHCAFKYAIANAELMILHVFDHDDLMEDDGEKNTTVSYTSADQHYIDQFTYDYDTKNEGYFQRNKNMIV